MRVAHFLEILTSILTHGTFKKYYVIFGIIQQIEEGQSTENITLHIHYKAHADALSRSHYSCDYRGVFLRVDDQRVFCTITSI